MRLRFAGLCLALTLGGCSTTLEPAKLDQTGRFSTPQAVAPGDAKVIKPFDKARFGRLAYVKTDSKVSKLNDFFVSSIKNTGAFDQVLTKEELEKLVLKRGLGGKVSDVSSLIGLNNLEKEIGPFVVIQPDVSFEGGYNFEATLKVIDPASADEMLIVKKKAFNWAGLDKPLFYPLFNALLDWTQGREILTQAPSQAPPLPPKA